MAGRETDMLTTDDVFKPLVDALNRQAEATERLVALAERDATALTQGLIEPGPPVCPNCGVFNPQVQISSDESEGPLGQFVLAAQCRACGNNLYAVAQGWMMFNSVEELLAAQKGDGDDHR